MALSLNGIGDSLDPWPNIQARVSTKEGQPRPALSAATRARRAPASLPAGTAFALRSSGETQRREEIGRLFPRSSPDINQPKSRLDNKTGTPPKARPSSDRGTLALPAASSPGYKTSATSSLRRVADTYRKPSASQFSPRQTFNCCIAESSRADWSSDAIALVRSSSSISHGYVRL